MNREWIHFSAFFSLSLSILLLRHLINVPKKKETQAHTQLSGICSCGPSHSFFFSSSFSLFMFCLLANQHILYQPNASSHLCCLYLSSFLVRNLFCTTCTCISSCWCYWKRDRERVSEGNVLVQYRILSFFFQFIFFIGLVFSLNLSRLFQFWLSVFYQKE